MNLRTHQRERSEELRELAGLLVQADLTPDASPLYAAAAACFETPRRSAGGQPGQERPYWGYDVSNLEIRLGDLRHLRPRGGCESGLSGLLSVSVQEFIPNEDDCSFEDLFTSIRSIGVDFHCESFVASETDLIETVKAAWHLDTHMFLDVDSHSVHPRFHFQFGGRALDGSPLSGILLTEEPRIAHPPLDAILAVDFVLSHYCGKSWKEQRDNDERYTRLVSPAFGRYWKTYHKQLYTLLSGTLEVDLFDSARALAPNIC